MKPYYRVYRHYKNSIAPRFETIAEAQEEAERLAREEKGATFEIAECVALSRVSEPVITFYMDGKSPEDNY